MGLKSIQTIQLSLTCVLFLTVVTGCATNPFISGHTGPRQTALPKDAPVRVLGADADDAEQIEAFDAALEQARQTATPMGVSSFVAGGTYRDAHAAQAARQLGANRVYYTFAYRSATVEQTQNFGYGFPVHTHAGSGSDDTVFIYSAPTTDSDTRHWWQYRAYFFLATD